jgi:nucleoside-diphosphate-sugar epimerase
MNKNDTCPNLREKNILVTGAAGFIGGNLVRELLKSCNRVVCLVRPGEDTSRIQGLDCRIVYGDLLDKSSLVDAVTGVDYIFHLAALLGGGTPEAFSRVNHEGTKNLIEVCREQGVTPKRFIFVSSTAVIGPSGKNVFLDENSPCRPVSDYGRSKLLAEEYLVSLKDSWPYTIIRLPLVYGPGSRGGLYIFFRLLSKGIQLNVGKLESTLCFVGDVVQGMIDAAENANASGEIYILGENKVYHFKEVCHTISSILGKRPVKIPAPYFLLYGFSFFFEIYSGLTNTVPVLTRRNLAQYFKYRYWRFDTSKAVRDFGFNSRFPLERGAKITIDWYRQNGFL